MPKSPLANAAPDHVALSDGKLREQARRLAHGVSSPTPCGHGAVDRIEQEKTTDPGHDATHANNTHAAIFAEVKVDEQLGVIRVTRVVSSVAAGRILNTKTAASQILGSVVWGIGMALHEETRPITIRPHHERQLAEYHVPVHADVHDDQSHLGR